MARFHFPLEKVLHWRSVEFSIEEAKLKQLGQEQIRLQMQISSLSAQMARTMESVFALPNLRGDDLRAMAAYGAALRRRSAKLLERSARVERELTVQRTKYAEAKRRMMLLEELRSRKFENWRKEQESELETVAAESFLSHWHRERL